MDEIIVRPDSKGKISLGELAKGVSSFRVILSDNRKIILEPYAEIPLEDKWIHEDKELLQKIKQKFQEKIA